MSHIRPIFALALYPICTVVQGIVLDGYCDDRCDATNRDSYCRISVTKTEKDFIPVIRDQSLSILWQPLRPTRNHFIRTRIVRALPSSFREEKRRTTMMSALLSVRLCWYSINRLQWIYIYIRINVKSDQSLLLSVKVGILNIATLQSD